MKTWIIVVMLFAVITLSAKAETQWEVKKTASSTDYRHKGCSVSVRNDGLGLTAQYSVHGVVTNVIVSTKKDGKEDVQERKPKEVVVDRVVYFSFAANCSDAIASLPALVRLKLKTPEMQEHLLYKRPALVTSREP